MASVVRSLPMMLLLVAAEVAAAQARLHRPRPLVAGSAAAIAAAPEPQPVSPEYRGEGGSVSNTESIEHTFPTLRVRFPICSQCSDPVPAPTVQFCQRLRGRVLYDTGFFNHHPYNVTLPPFEDAQAIRSARIGVDGICWEWLRYRAEVDFANGDGFTDGFNGVVQLKDVFVETPRLPVFGNVRAGYFKEPFSLEQQTEQTNWTFMERSVMDRGRPIVADPFVRDVQASSTDLVPERNTGVMAQKTLFDGRLWGAFGWFRVDSDEAGFDNGDGDYAYTARVTGLALWQQDGRRLLHLGAAYSYREYREPAPGSGNLPAYTTRLATLGTPLLLNTGILQRVDCGDFFGGELAAVCGPFALQAEYVFATLERTEGANLNYWGAYIYASYFLTGEHRRYDKQAAAFGRVVPRQNFFCVANGCHNPFRQFWLGKGAWEVAVRYSIVDLRSNLVRPVDGLLHPPIDESLEGGAGIVQEWTLGLNWHWNPNVRIMLNAVRTTRESDSVGYGLVSAVLWRVQVDW